MPWLFYCSILFHMRKKHLSLSLSLSLSFHKKKIAKHNKKKIRCTGQYIPVSSTICTYSLPPILSKIYTYKMVEPRNKLIIMQVTIVFWYAWNWWLQFTQKNKKIFFLIIKKKTRRKFLNIAYRVLITTFRDNANKIQQFELYENYLWFIFWLIKKKKEHI